MENQKKQKFLFIKQELQTTFKGVLYSSLTRVADAEMFLNLTSQSKTNMFIPTQNEDFQQAFWLKCQKLQPSRQWEFVETPLETEFLKRSLVVPFANLILSRTKWFWQSGLLQFWTDLEEFHTRLWSPNNTRLISSSNSIDNPATILMTAAVLHFVFILFICVQCSSIAGFLVELVVATYNKMNIRIKLVALKQKIFYF